ncbi:MAG: 2Fe-2S iron-sulfur cluster binding domain-containing protein [Comamonadaceae bacterium]|nr:MAG: 2Fe-2S iron-sulfur cluster binding domain-containing protein [Comamonadaceae bacterium]
MGRVVFVQPDGSKQEVEAVDGQSVMQVARANLVPGIVAECGGELSCATCHVIVDEQWAGRLPGRSADEEDMLEVAAEEPAECSRLSCQVRFESALSNLVPGIIGECGGELTCATCQVYVGEGWADRLPPITADEESMLDVAAEHGPTSRLSCQLTCRDESQGLVVRIPDMR